MKPWLALALLLGSTLARADKPGVFDYYVLALSWSPQYCASEARPGDVQCARPYAFVVHGLWPQHERGWPSDCGRGEYLGDSLIADALRFMPSKGLVIHEWRKHGVCTGLTAREYFDTARRAYESIRVPARYLALDKPLVTSVSRIESDFLAANPRLTPQRIGSQCAGRYLKELRVCFTRGLQARDCGADVRDRCGSEVVLRPVR